MKEAENLQLGAIVHFERGGNHSSILNAIKKQALLDTHCVHKNPVNNGGNVAAALFQSLY